MYYSDELYHHGIKGQRWGRRNGPPYPLSPQTHASVVRSAGRGGYTGSKSAKRRGRIGGMSPEEEKAARRKRILRNVAIGAGAAAALGGAGYLAYRNRDALVRYARTAGAKGRQGLTQARLGAKRVRYAAKDNLNRVLFKGKNAANAAGNVVGNSANAVATSAKAAGESAQTAARMASARARQEAVQARLAAKRARYAAKDISNKAAFETGKAVSNAAKSVGSTATNTGRGIRDIFNRGTSSAATAGRTAVAKGRQGLTQARLGAKRVRYAAKDIGGRAAFKTARFYRNNPWAMPASALGAVIVGGNAYGIAKNRRRKKKRSSRR